MRGHLIRIDAAADDGTGAIVRLASVDDARLCHLDAVQWDPAIARLPVLSYDFFGGAFQNAITATRAQFAVALAGLVLPVPFARLRFADARVRVWSGSVGAGFGSFALRFDGRIAAEPEVAGLVASFTARPDDRWLDAPLLETYAGTGGIEGGEDLTGSVKPLVLGACRLVPGVLIDAVDNVWQVSAGSVQAVSAVYDRLVSLGASFGNYADLAALLAAPIPEGRWATCHALGLVRLGWPADGKLSFDVSGDNGGGGGFVRKPGAVIGRVAELAGGTASAANLAALDVARPWNQSLVLSEQTTARAVIQQIADSVVAVAGMSHAGMLFAQPLGFAQPVATLNPAGTALPLVGGVSQAPVAAPFWRLATEAERSWTVYDTAEIASEYLPRGTYSAARTYRVDDLVFADDGRSFVYINAVPGAGNAPPAAPTTANAHWQQFGTADNTAAAQISIDPIPVISVTADHTNVTTSALAVLTRRVVIRRGETDVSASATFTLGTAPGGIAAAFGTGADKNLFTLSQCDAAGSFPVTVTLSGITYGATIEIERVRAAPPVVGGAGNAAPISDSSFSSINSGSFVEIATPGIIKSNASGVLEWVASAQYAGDPGFTAAFKAQYSLNGTTWTDAAAEFSGTAVALDTDWYSYGYLIPGYIYSAQTKTGLTANTDYHWRLLARRSAGSGTGTFSDEIFQVVQP